MKFESKYLIRWGIPGWVFIFLVGLPLINIHYDSLISKNFSMPQILGLFASLALFGVPLGYLMHQFYFFVNWLRRDHRTFDNALALVEKGLFVEPECWKIDNVRDYFYFEFIWQRELIKLDKEKREYISERYRHFLTTIHGLGSLLVSLITSLIFNGYIIVKEYKELIPWQFIVYLFIIVILIYSTLRTFNYYSKNLNHFQGFFLNSMLKGELKEEKNTREVIDLDRIKKAPSER
jgi:hypothetical protein